MFHQREYKVLWDYVGESNLNEESGKASLRKWHLRWELKDMWDLV